MNELFANLGLSSAKAWLGALAMPPVPLLLLAVLGALLMRRRPRLARGLVLLSLAGLWAACMPGTGHWLIDNLTRPPPPLRAPDIAALANAPHTAIVVLGAGRRPQAAEYGDGADLRPLTLARLRYGVWLARQTGLPMAFTGGVGHGSAPGVTEAEAVQQSLARDQDPPLRWVEKRSRDTDENARFSLALLQADGIQQLVLVTHDFHQRRALADFERAIARSGRPMKLVPAPMGQAPPLRWFPSDFMPTAEGLAMTRWALHEWLGRLAGA